jgi:energy-coupling factor transporter ATP-binding protein EcfA2
MVAMVNLVEVVELGFTHIGKSQPTLAGVNLVLYPGEIVLIAGATGSGKSTLLNCIAGIAPTHIGGRLTGDILYQGGSIIEYSVRERAQYMGTILQNVETQIFTDRVVDEVIFGLENLNVSADIIADLAAQSLQEFGLFKQRDWLVSQLSAGQKQRLVLSCVLVMNQPVLLLDEPFAYLDRAGGELLVQLLVHRARRGQAVLLVEHRWDLVREICNRTYYFHQGTLEPELPASHTPTPRHAKTSLSLFNSPRVTLQTQQLSWGDYPAFPDLEVLFGETILLQGDNGSGKTTLLKLLSGLLKPTTGIIEILGKNIARQRVVEIAKTVGFVLQNPNHQLFAETVHQEVLQPQVSTQQAEQLLERLNLSSMKQQHPQSLSQGQKRRLALAGVLARQPKICLLDEITVGQDSQSLALMIDVLIDFTHKGGTLILTTHDSQVGDFLNAQIVSIQP